MTSKVIKGSMAIFCMPIIHTPFSLMYVMRLSCVSSVSIDRKYKCSLLYEVHDDEDGVWY
jgi:hypothetical protein